MKETLLRIDDLSFAYEKTPVLDDISLSIGRGEIFCLLGPNGCGKTTMLDCILGLNDPGENRIFLQERDVAGMKPAETARLMAYVPQDHEKNFSFTVREVILMGRTAFTGFFEAPGEEDRKMADEILKKMNFYHLRERDYTRLSGGEGQMVMIMRALIQEAGLVVMDEPACHLDFRNELILMETILSIVESGDRSILMTTHSPNQAFFLENRNAPVRVGLMDKGKIVKTGAPSEVLTAENIASVYGVQAEVVRGSSGNNGEETTFSSLVPIRTKEKT